MDGSPACVLQPLNDHVLHLPGPYAFWFTISFSMSSSPRKLHIFHSFFSHSYFQPSFIHPLPFPQAHHPASHACQAHSLGRIGRSSHLCHQRYHPYGSPWPEFGWVCLGSCGADVTTNALALFFVTSSYDDTAPHDTVTQPVIAVP